MFESGEQGGHRSSGYKFEKNCRIAFGLATKSDSIFMKVLDEKTGTYRYQENRTDAYINVKSVLDTRDLALDIWFDLLRITKHNMSHDGPPDFVLPPPTMPPPPDFVPPPPTMPPPPNKKIK